MNEEDEKIEAKTHGELGDGEIVRLSTGARKIRVRIKGKEPMEASSQEVDLQSLEVKRLEQALEKVCHETGELLLMQRKQQSGSKALVISFHRKGNPEEGYASVIKKGKGALKFALDRLDLKAMEVRSVEEALRKIAHETGRAILDTPKRA